MMTYNVLDYGTPDSGQRRELVHEVIGAADPDVLAILSAQRT